MPAVNDTYSVAAGQTLRVGVPYDLSGYTIPFSYSWPIAPTITSEHTVSNSSELAIANISGARITLQAGNYGNVSPANDQEWILESDAIIDTFTFTGSQRVKVRGSTPRVGRIGRVTSEASGTTDILFDGVYITSHSGSIGDIWSSPNGQRIAIVNSALRSQSYVIFPVTADSSLSNNLIVAGNYIYTSSSVPAGAVYGNQHAMRCMSVNTTIIADNYIQKDDGGQGIRIHSNDSPATGTYDVFIGGNTLAYASGLGFAQCITVQPSSGNDFPQGIARVYVESNEMHNNSGGCIALQDDTTDGGVATAPLYDACEFNNNNAYGSLGLPGDLSPYSSTASGNTENPYTAAPSAASVLGWTP